MNPHSLSPYFKAEEIKNKRLNEQYWLLGHYIYDATTMALATAFRSKGSKPVPYLKKPYEYKTSDELERENRERVMMEKQKAAFKAFADVINKKFKTKEGEING